MKQTLFIAVLILLSWGNLAIIAGRCGLSLPLFHPWLSLVVWSAGPPIAALMALISWKRARQWRRMETLRAAPENGPAAYLARGAHQIVHISRGPSSLERWTRRLLGLALAAMPFWWGLPLPGSWAAALLITLWALGGMLR